MKRKTFRTIDDARDFLKEYLTIPPVSYPRNYNIEAIINEILKRSPYGYYFCACTSPENKQRCTESEKIICNAEMVESIQHHFLA